MREAIYKSVGEFRLPSLPDGINDVCVEMNSAPI